jgi:hypothetical protein
MDIDEESFLRPDLDLLCQDGKYVQAHSCLLVLASAPLRPAILMAFKEAAARNAAPSLAVDGGSAEAWQQALGFLDPKIFSKPPVGWVSSGAAGCRLSMPAGATVAQHARSCPSSSCAIRFTQTRSPADAPPQDNVEPLLRLAHMYELQAVGHACAAFLTQRITKDAYTSLPEAQLRQLRHWLEVAVELGLSWLRTAVLECLQDCTLKAVQPAFLNTTDPRNNYSYDYYPSNPRMSSCDQVRCFQHVWGKAPGAKSNKQTPANLDYLDAALSNLQAGELRPLLKELLLPAFSKAV